MSKATEDEKAAPAENGIRGELITMKETARCLHMSVTWLYNQRQKGCLPFRLLQPSPGRFFCDSADVDTYLSTCWRPAGTKT